MRRTLILPVLVLAGALLASCGKGSLTATSRQASAAHSGGPTSSSTPPASPPGDQTSSKQRAVAFAHAVNLTGLTPGTTYHFRTKSIDAAGNIGSMHDLTFTTAK